MTAANVGGPEADGLAMGAPGAAADVLPLAGVRVLDFGTAWAGPMCGHIMADLGAEVIKVESKLRMDGLRLGRPIVGEDLAGGDRGEWPELQPVFHALNRNKLGITVNLKQPEGVELIKRLAAMSDAGISNFSPGVMDRMGLEYEVIAKLNRKFIMISMTGAGDSGPQRDVVSYNSIVLGLSGVGSLLGYEDDFIGMTQTGFADAWAALTGTWALLVALWERDRTGLGQYVELSEWEGTSTLLAMQILDYGLTGRVTRARENYSPVMAPHDNYQTADGWIALAVRGEDKWRRLCEVAGHPEWLQNPHFADLHQRLVYLQELNAAISEWTQSHDTASLFELLSEAGLASAPVMTIEDQFSDPHFQERGIHMELEHPRVGLELVHGIPFGLSDTPGRLVRPAPTLGQHNEYVFGELLGLSTQEIARLVEAQVIA